MASEILAIKAASGLVNLMSKKPVSGAIRDSTVAQISAALFYKTNVMAKLASNPQFQSAFRNVIFDQLEVDFGDYVDAKARTSPKSFHHVYEWGKTGNKGSRLFSLKTISKDGLSFSIKNEIYLKSSKTNSFTIILLDSKTLGISNFIIVHNSHMQR